MLPQTLIIKMKVDSMTTQTKQAKHTPLPWDALVGPIVTVGINGQGAICQCGEQPRLGGLYLDRDTAIANAQLIVKAVNSHTELLEALQVCERAMMKARLDAGKVDEENGDRLNHKHHKVFPCNQAVVHATQDALDIARNATSERWTFDGQSVLDAQGNNACTKVNGPLIAAAPELL
jgi:hypothetical protein